MDEIILAALQHGYVYYVKLKQNDIDYIRTYFILNQRMVSKEGTLTILTPNQIHLIQTNVYMQYLIPGTELRITLEPCANSQFDWSCPAFSNMHYFIRVEGV